MLLEADTLIYDNDDDTVTAVGGVQIDYGGNKLVAQRVIYNRKTRRLVASGNVADRRQRAAPRSIPTRSTSPTISRDGFVNALRVETIDKTYFAAESAERSGGILTTFNNGVYTACEPCEDKPDKAPIWRIKAQKIIWNGKAKTVRFENSPASSSSACRSPCFPAFEIADPTVKRKTGFLFPGVSYKSDLGVGVTVPYYFALSPTYDLTVTGTGYTEQGFLGEAEWRQRFNNGEYSVKIAGINQANPDAFELNTVDSGPAGDPNRIPRHGRLRRAAFAINPRWDFGWDVLVQTDKNFSRTYGIGGFDEFVHRSEVYLTGLDDRNYFDLRGMHFEVQEDARCDEHPEIAPQRRAALGAAELRLFLHAGRAGGRRRAQFRRQRPRDQPLDKLDRRRSDRCGV